MALQEYSYNSEEYSFIDMNIVLGGRPVAGFEEMRYQVDRVKEAKHASGKEPWSIQKGQKSYSGQITMLQSEIEALTEAVQALGYDDLTDIPLAALIAYKRNFTDPIKTDEIVGLEITSVPKGGATGDTDMPVAMPFIALKINFNV